MSNLLAIVSDLNLSSVGKVFAESGMFPDIKSQAQAIVKVIAGQELGLPSVYSMMKIRMIQGQVTLAPEAMAALIKSSQDYDYKVTGLTNESCTIQFYQRHQDKTWELVYTSTFSMTDARTAGLVKDGSGWQKWPRAMLYARAMSQGARIACPHVIGGTYTPEELGATVDSEGQVIDMPPQDTSQTVSGQIDVPASVPTPPPQIQESSSPSSPIKSEHWCDEHQTEWFQRSGMKTPAHPIEGQPGKWCVKPGAPQNAPRQAQEPKALPVATPTTPGSAEKVNLQDYPWHAFRKDMEAEIARLPGKDWQVPVVITDPNMGEWVAAASEQLTKLSLNAPDVWVTLFGANPTKGQIVGLNRAIISSLSQFSFDQVAGAIVGLAADREPEETATPFDGTELVFEGDDKGDDKK